MAFIKKISESEIGKCSLRPTKTFAGCKINQPPDIANDLFDEILNYFKKRVTTQVSFEIMFNFLKSKKSPAWQYYVQDERSRFRAFLKACNGKFKFPDNSLTYLYMRIMGPTSVKCEHVNVAFEIENIENNRDLFENLHKTYDIVYEFEAIYHVAFVFTRLTEYGIVGQVDLDFLIRVLSNRFDSSPDLDDLKQYMNLEENSVDGGAVSFFKNRTFLFVLNESNKISFRPPYFVEIVYRLNEFLREPPDGVAVADDVTNKNWTPLNSLIEFYLRTPRISDEFRQSINLTSRDAFLNFLGEHRVVFDLRLRKDFQVASNLLLPEIDWAKFGVSVSNYEAWICKDFERILNSYKMDNEKYDEEDFEDCTPPDDLQRGCFYQLKNVESDTSEKEILPVAEFVAQPLPSNNASVAKSPKKAGRQSGVGISKPNDSVEKSQYTQIRPLSSFLSSKTGGALYGGSPPFIVSTPKNRSSLGPKPSPIVTKPLLNIIRNFNPRMDALKKSGDVPATVRRQQQPVLKTFSSWDDQIESELESCFVEDLA